MFTITNPALRQKMVKAKIFWNRYQTKYDLKIYRVCLELHRQLVSHVFFDRNHLINVVLVRRGPATPIYDLLFNII